MELRVRNVNSAVQEGFWKMKIMGVRESSRNGEVVRIPEPVMTTYENPTERVLFWPERDANPIFHLMESLWMLAGRDDVSFVEYFNKRMRTFSDDGVVLNGAYGHRWRNRFGTDQLSLLIEHLKANPDTRRAVLTMWGVDEDLREVDTSKDVCCNTQCFFEIQNDKLNMTVLNRSNDMIWGAYGANAVHFSMLQEFIATAVGVPIGVYRQFSHNLHMYTELYDYGKYVECPPDTQQYDAYLTNTVRPYQLCSSPWQQWLRDCELFCEDPFADPVMRYYDPFFSRVAYPMAMVARERKSGAGNGYFWAEMCEAEDWKLAARQWIDRREAAKNAK
jgi:hypothetical protein